MEKLVPAMDEPRRRPLTWETQALSSEVFLRYILSRVFAFTSHLFVSFPWTGAARDAAAVAAPVLGVNWARGPLFDWWAISCPIKVVRWLLGQNTPVKKTCTDQEGRWRLEYRLGVEKRWERRCGPDRGSLIGISPVTPETILGFPCAPPPEEQCSSSAVQASNLALDSPLPFHTLFHSSRNPMGAIQRNFRI